MNYKLIISSKKTAQFLYKSLSEYLDNVSIKVEIINYFSFWSVYIDDKPICEDVSKTGVMNRVFDRIMFEIDNRKPGKYVVISKEGIFHLKENDKTVFSDYDLKKVVRKKRTLEWRK